MKNCVCRSIALWMIAIILLTSAACDPNSLVQKLSKPKFESQEEMFDIANGVWLIDEHPNDTYLLIHNEEVQKINISKYKQAIGDVMTSTLESNGFDPFKDLRELTFESTLDAITANNAMSSTLYDVSADADQGVITLTHGGTPVSHIVFDNDTVGIRYENSKTVIPLQRISDSTDLSGEPFREIFTHTKKYFNVPINWFWMDARSYGDYIQATETNSYWWVLASDSEDSTTYTTDPLLASTISGVLTISDERVDYMYSVEVSNSWDPDFNPYFMITYCPKEGKISIIDHDNTALSMLRLIRIGSLAVESYPGAYDDYVGLNNALAEIKPSISYGFATVELKRNGLIYTMTYTEDGSYARFDIVCEDNISLDGILQMIPICSQCNLEEPATLFDSNWETGDICLRCAGENVWICEGCNHSYVYNGSSYCDGCMP